MPLSKKELGELVSKWKRLNKLAIDDDTLEKEGLEDIMDHTREALVQIAIQGSLKIAIKVALDPEGIHEALEDFGNPPIVQLIHGLCEHKLFAEARETIKSIPKTSLQSRLNARKHILYHERSRVAVQEFKELLNRVGAFHTHEVIDGWCDIFLVTRDPSALRSAHNEVIGTTDKMDKYMHLSKITLFCEGQKHINITEEYLESAERFLETGQEIARLLTKDPIASYLMKLTASERVVANQLINNHFPLVKLVLSGATEVPALN